MIFAGLKLNRPMSTRLRTVYLVQRCTFGFEESSSLRRRSNVRTERKSSIDLDPSDTVFILDVARSLALTLSRFPSGRGCKHRLGVTAAKLNVDPSKLEGKLYLQPAVPHFMLRRHIQLIFLKPRTCAVARRCNTDAPAPTLRRRRARLYICRVNFITSNASGVIPPRSTAY